MKKIISLLLVLALLTCFAGCATRWMGKTPTRIEKERDPSSPVLYKATDDRGNMVYMLGSIHVGTDAMYPLPRYVLDAYEESDALAVEIDMIAASKDIAGAMDMVKAMLLTDGTKISDHISKACYDRAVEILKKNKAYSKALDMYEPVMWYSLISTFAMEEAGAKSDRGIDMYFLEQAYDEDKTIYEVESAAYQYEVLGGMSMELQAFLLEQTVAEYDSELYSASILDMCDAWANGDEEGILASEETDTSAMSPEEAKLYDEFNTALEGNRNVNMTQYAEDALLSGETVFIVVGAAHVMGEDGMAQGLRALGYTVERIQQ